MFENFRGKLHMVQQDFSSSFKTLGDISRETKLKRRSRFEESSPHCSAGLEILSRYEKSWFLLHKRSKDCAQLAESVDGEIVMLSALWERRKAALTQLQEQLQCLPDFINELDAITANIAHLEGDFEEMESKLVYLETLCCQSEQQTVKTHHMNELDAYKKKKRKEVELLEAELNCEHAQRVAEMELTIQQKLRERQKVYEEAFHQDMEQYLSTGCLQNRESVGPDVSLLDEMTVANLTDQEALDDFLNSVSEEISAGSSPTSGPDHESCSSESLTQAPPIDNHLSNQAGEWQEEQESAELLVQSDEEDVQADMSLVALQDTGPTWSSDESNSAGDQSP
ncbi:dysbindin-A [Kryptolebias marmoratus]|uniref:Dysbindin-A-like n=1 Tax=Kryptolebias marmoratus TaxID=37003 RepID=A0A3Q3AVB4_KRYMA|nr:dysbindin-A [Kryptolebias marmoratus]